MLVQNFLPHLLDALRLWEDPPDPDAFASFLAPIEPLLRPMLDDFGSRTHIGLHEVVESLNWPAYRAEALLLDPAAEERRVRRIIGEVEGCLGIQLTGEVILFGAFTAMDGYARFDRGAHRVYLGVDESHIRGAYIDVLIAHELTHVAREPLPEIWKGFGLSPDMTHDQFVENLPTIEHLMGEGFSCAVSELICPREPSHNYVYQSEASLLAVLEHGPAVDAAVHAALRNPKTHYSSLYDPARYSECVPRYAHYVWAWLWVSHLLKDLAGSNPRRLLGASAHDLVEDALSFRLPRSLEASR